jgi:hypothetical protein
MGDLAIESGQFKVGATAKDAQEMVKAKLDEGDLFDDITKVCCCRRRAFLSFSPPCSNSVGLAGRCRRSRGRGDERDADADRGGVRGVAEDGRGAREGDGRQGHQEADAGE